MVKDMMPEYHDSIRQPEPSSEKRLRLMSKELEEATKQFLVKVEELEKLLPLIDE